MHVTRLARPATLSVIITVQGCTASRRRRRSLNLTSLMRCTGRRISLSKEQDDGCKRRAVWCPSIAASRHDSPFLCLHSQVQLFHGTAFAILVKEPDEVSHLHPHLKQSGATV